MFKKIFNYIYLFLIFVSIFLTVKYYFSEKNIILINKSRSFYSLNTSSDLPILQNDTDNIVVFKTDLEDFKKKRKKRFWEKLISNKNE